MNVIPPHSQAGAVDRTLVASQEHLGRSLNRLSAGSRIGLPATASSAAGAVSERFDAHAKRVHSALTDVQNATSAVQTADRFLGDLTDTLTLMSDLADTAGDSTQRSPASDAQKFQDLQERLRQAVGGTAAPAVAFDGINLFGPEDRSNPSGADVNPASLPTFRLRAGAISTLVRHDGSGNYVLGASDPATSDVLKSALQDVTDARADVSAAGARYQLEAATLQVESENLSSALAPIRDEASGGELTRAATTSILMQPASAFFAQANLAPQGAFRLLES